MEELKKEYQFKTFLFDNAFIGFFASFLLLPKSILSFLIITICLLYIIYYSMQFNKFDILDRK